MTVSPEDESTGQEERENPRPLLKSRLTEEERTGPPPDDSADRFIDILNNRGSNEPHRSDQPVRGQGFSVLARDGFDLWPLQALCGKSNQSWIDGLTVRYRLRPGAIFGTLLTAFLVDLEKIYQGKTDDLAGVFFPGAAEPDWREFSQRWSKNIPRGSALGDIVLFASEQFEGPLSREQLNELLKVLSLEEILPRQKRLVLFAEVYGGDSAAAVEEWKTAKTVLLDRLPERVGLVFSGAPAAFKLEDAPHFLELSLSRIGAPPSPLPPPPPRFRFKQGSLHSDLPTDKDTLGVKNDAQALARFVLHPQTEPPLTIGIHGPWGKGKSSFMKLVDDALIDKVLEDRSARTDGELTTLESEISEIEQRLEEAPETEAAKLRGLHRAKTARYDERRRYLAEPGVLTVPFNAWQFEDAKQIWAGLASVISERLEQALPRRHHAWMRIRYAWNERRSDLLLNVALPLLVGLAIALYLVVNSFGSFANAVSSSLTLREALALLLPFGSLAVLVWVTSKQVLSVVQPMSQRVLSYIQLPSYREQMGYQHRVMDDLQFVYGCLKRYQDHESKVVVFIDDLDRCSEEKIMEVLQAITLILGDSKFFVFLGMDTEMIYRAIRIHYTKGKRREALPFDLPEKYLRKIVQVSFHLPATAMSTRLAYVTSLFTVMQSVAKEPLRPGPLDDKAPPPPDGGLPVNFRYIDQPPPLEVEDTQVELDTFRSHLVFLKDNPREIKRLINLHRLVKILLTVKQQQLLSREAQQRQLVRWLIFCAVWPDHVDYCLAVAEELPPSPDILRDLIEKLKVDNSYQENYPQRLQSLEKFASLSDHTPFSAQNINDFRLAVQISTLVSESVVTL